MRRIGWMPYFAVVLGAWVAWGPGWWAAWFLCGGAGLLAWRGVARRPVWVWGAMAVVVGQGALAWEGHRQGAYEEVREYLGEARQVGEMTVEVVSGAVRHEGGYAMDGRVVGADFGPDGGWGRAKVRGFYPTRGVEACEPLPLPGERVTAWARVERFGPQEVPWQRSRRELMEGRGYVGSVTLLEVPVVEPGGQVRSVMRGLAVQRIELERRLQRHLDGDGLAIAMAMLTGSRGLISRELREPFDVTSTGHILAISGLHFGVIAALMALSLRVVLDRVPRVYEWAPRRTVVGVVTLVGLLGYLLAIGAPVSAQRAFGMAAVGIVVFSCSPWRMSALSALGATASVLLVWRPSLLFEVGFQLSVAATAGICLYLAVCPRGQGKVRAFCGVSVAATLATWPVLLQMTGELPLSALWTNLVVVPVVSAVVFPGLVAGALLTTVWDPLAGWVLWVCAEALLWIRSGLEVAAYLPGSTVRWGTPTGWELVLLSGAVGWLILDGFRRSAWPGAVALGVGLVVVHVLPGMVEEPTVKVHFLPVGQGDATVVELPDGQTVLVDGGGRPVGSDPGLERVVPALRHLGVRRLDAVILTHGDYDHYGGLPAVIAPFRPRRFYVDPDEETPAVVELARLMEASGAEVWGVDGVERILSRDSTVTIYRPELPEADANDRSLVVALTYGSVGVLLPGDLEAAGEAWLVENVPGRRALLKVPHHGSRTSSSMELLAHVQPRVAVSSSGRHSRFDHPHEEVVERYGEVGSDLFGTHAHGMVTATISAAGELRVRRTRDGPPPPLRDVAAGRSVDDR